MTLSKDQVANSIKSLSILGEVLEEKFRAESVHGKNSWPDGTGMPEDEVNRNRAQQVTARMFELGEGTWSDILFEEVYEAVAESDAGKLREELVQVAAVCLAWIEDIDTRDNLQA